MTNYAKKHPYLLSFIIIIILLIALLVAGFRLQPDLRVSKNGTVEIALPLASTTVYIDTQKITTTNIENEMVTKSLSVKTHTVLIGRPGYLPWIKDVVIQPNTTVVLKPIFITANATGQIITKNDKDYWTLRNKIQSSPLPTEASPRQGPNGTLIWVKDNTIYVRGAYSGGPLGEREADTFSVITPVDSIRSVDFYADRTDVIIFASDTGVYALDAIENAAEHKANFLPIYKGAKPVFLKTDNTFLYVLDQENLMMVVI